MLNVVPKQTAIAFNILHGGLEMRLIDFHAHIYPDRVAKRATQSTSEFYEVETVQTGSGDCLEERGREAGIEEFVILPVATKAIQVHSMNKFVLDQAQKHTCFHPFGTIHAETKNMDEEIDFMFSSGIEGLKIHPDTQGFNIDDERMFPVYDRLSGKMPIVFHCGDPRFNFSHPARMKRVIKMFPKLEVIAAHLGGWKMFDIGFEELKDCGCYFDLSSSTMLIDNSGFRKYVDAYGADKILFGTDFPLWDPVKEVETFMKLPLTDDEREKIAYLNAEGILKRSSR